MSKLEELIQKLCPDGVEWRELGEICEFKRGQSIKSTEVIEGDIPVISGGQKPAFYHNVSNRDANCITVAGSGAYAGFVSYWDKPIFCADSFTIDIKNSSMMDIKYLYYFLKNKQNYIYALKKGAGIAHVYGKDMGKIKIPFTSLDIQEEIVHILDSFTELINQLTNELTARRKQYEYYRDNLLTFGDEVEWKELGEICDTITDYVAAGSFADISKNVNYKKSEDFAQLIRTVDIKNNFLKADYIYVDECAFNYLWRVNLNEESIILPNIGVNCGEVYYITPSDLPHKENVLGPNAILVRSSKCINKYLFYIFSTKLFQRRLKKIISPAGQTKFNKTDFKSLQIPFPPLSEQERIVSILDKFDSLCNDISEGLPAEIEARKKQYEYYRDKLLTFKNKNGT